MFTGIIETVGTVVTLADGDEARTLAIRAPKLTPDLGIGHSIAVDGACLTVVELEGGLFSVTAIGTTLSRTVASSYRQGTRVNLERSLLVGDRLDGHFVQGHVDGVGELVQIVTEGDSRLLDVRIPRDVDEITVLHGSIALNGVSLTVNALPQPGVCQVAIIPHTWTSTNLSDLVEGDPVNVEGDLIGKHVGRMLANRHGQPGRLR